MIPPSTRYQSTVVQTLATDLVAVVSAMIALGIRLLRTPNPFADHANSARAAGMLVEAVAVLGGSEYSEL
jgi:hypothetical protein